MRNKRNAGLTLAELILAVGVMVIIMSGVLAFQYVAMRRNTQAKDRHFAALKALALLEEVRTNSRRAVDVLRALDDMDDGDGNYNVILTTHKTNDPQHPLSGNVNALNSSGSAYWKFSRNIRIQSFGGESTADMRIVRVTMAITTPEGGRVPLASVGAIIQAPLQEYPPSQVYDVYLLTAESSPSWWVHMSKTRDNFESQLLDMMARNPGLSFRSHWVKASGYGRNHLYLPYLNSTRTAIVDPMAFAYIYPGKHKYSDGTGPDLYYWPEIFQGRINDEGTIRNDYIGPTGLTNPQASTPYNPWPYALCDRFNHDMRYPEALEYYNKRKAARDEYIRARRTYLSAYKQEIATMGSSTKDPNLMPELPPEEMTFRLLMEEMVTNPSKFHNAIFLNLHGEMLPLPAMRNYSDPAKDPLDYPGVRVVAHPERVHFRQDTGTPANSHSVKLRVYSYLNDIVHYSDDSTTPIDNRYHLTNYRLNTPITMVFRNVDLTHNINDKLSNSHPSLIIKRVTGGYIWTKAGAANTSYAIDNAPIYRAETDGIITQATSVTPPIKSDGVADGVEETPTNANEMYIKYRLLKIDKNGDGVVNVANGDEMHTVLYLYNSPLRCPRVANKSGLLNTKRLYRTEYIPCSPGGPTSSENFPRNLTDTQDRYKNTARWIIEIPNEMVAPPGTNNPDPNNTFPNIATEVAAGRRPNIMLKVETRIGADLGPAAVDKEGVGVLTEAANSSGTMYPPTDRYKPENISKAYVWWTADLKSVPFTELFQYIGDPRHSPYVDTIKNSAWPDTGWGTVGNGYNPYFDNETYDFSDIIDDGITKNGWGIDYDEIDIPRYQQLIRRAIVNSELLYTTLTGFSYYYVGVGGEIGVDSANGYPRSVEINDYAYGGTGKSTVNEYAGDNGGGTTHMNITYVEKQRSGTDFALLNWLGELYHDADYRNMWGREITSLAPYNEAASALSIEADKVVGGNVVAGPNNGRYRRVQRDASSFQACNNSNTKLFSGCKHRMRHLGCGALLHIYNSSSKIFIHRGRDGGTGLIQPEGEGLATGYALPLPDSIKSSRPWTINQSVYNEQYTLKNYSYWKNCFFCIFDGSRIREYYRHNGTTETTSGLLRINFRDSTSVNLAKTSVDPYLETDNYGYIAVNGIDRATEEATATINKLSLVTLLHSFLDLGREYRARMLPHVKITAPKVWEMLPINPQQTTIKWSLSWTRWDGSKYTPLYADNSYPPSTDQGFPFRPGTATMELNNLIFVPMMTTDLTMPWIDLIKYNQGITGADLLREPGNHPDESVYTNYTTDGAYLTIAANGDYQFQFNLNDSTAFPSGTYYFRVECFRKNEIQHYSYHQQILEVRRD